MNHKAFTLIEMLIVLVVIGILTAVTLRLNRWQIDDMRAMNEREQRLARHRKNNTLLTNTNYMNITKITEAQFIYTNTGIILSSSWWESQFSWKNNILSGNTFIITKKALALWCESDTTQIELIWPHKTTCFTLNTHICSRTPCSTTK